MPLIQIAVHVSRAITGGASQNIGCVLQSFTDPVATKAIWMVAPCYHLASAMFNDSGFAGRLRATPEDEEGIDLDVLEKKIVALEEKEALEIHGPSLKLRLQGLDCLHECSRWCALRYGNSRF